MEIHRLLEVPSNMLLKKLRRPSIFIGCIVVCWSICVIGQGVTASFEGLVVCRVLIGIFEAGLFPGKAASSNSSSMMASRKQSSAP